MTKFMVKSTGELFVTETQILGKNHFQTKQDRHEKKLSRNLTDEQNVRLVNLVAT